MDRKFVVVDTENDCILEYGDNLTDVQLLIQQQVGSAGSEAWLDAVTGDGIVIYERCSVVHLDKTVKVQFGGKE